ncbi:hypothetical protein U9M48_038657 [Paspalum notatum var. saurae]|uniref:Uncharacterized protein n=1 Tax=Paspalum notatum var. saurae TaxID=547442 RepID=A0AAQ3XB99_PASNO
MRRVGRRGCGCCWHRRRQRRPRGLCSVPLWLTQPPAPQPGRNRKQRPGAWLQSWGRLSLSAVHLAILSPAQTQVQQHTPLAKLVYSIWFGRRWFFTMGEEAPRPRSPPRYPDLCGRRRLQLEVQILSREVGFLEQEIQGLERLQPVSRCCKDGPVLATLGLFTQAKGNMDLAGSLCGSDQKCAHVFHACAAGATACRSPRRQAASAALAAPAVTPPSAPPQAASAVQRPLRAAAAASQAAAAIADRSAAAAVPVTARAPAPAAAAAAARDARLLAPSSAGV